MQGPSCVLKFYCRGSFCVKGKGDFHENFIYRRYGNHFISSASAYHKPVKDYVITEGTSGIRCLVRYGD